MSETKRTVNEGGAIICPFLSFFFFYFHNSLQWKILYYFLISLTRTVSEDSFNEDVAAFQSYQFEKTD